MVKLLPKKKKKVGGSGGGEAYGQHHGVGTWDKGRRGMLRKDEKGGQRG